VQTVRIALLALHFAEYAARLAAALSARHQVLLLLRAGNAEAELTDELRIRVERAAQVHYLKGRRWRDPRMLATSFTANRIIRRFAPDVIHAQEAHPLLVGWTMLSARRTTPVVLTVHDPIGHSGSSTAHGWLWKSLLWQRRMADRVIVHGPQMQTEAEAIDRRLINHVDVVPHGALCQEGDTRFAQHAEPATFLFFGRVESYKGLRYLLDACDILRHRDQKLKVVVAGTGTDLERHRTRIATMDCVELIDSFVPAAEVGALFRRATAAVLPYTDATQSGVAAIALANSCPVIASSVGDLPDMVIHQRTGLLVPPRNAVALANAMEELICNADLRDSLAAIAGRHAREKLSWPRIAELTTAAYEKAIESHRLRGAPRQASWTA
jgi:glycosyltransferase involved in cell wall biosynthesis